MTVNDIVCCKRNVKRSWPCFLHSDSLCCLGFFETTCVNDLLFIVFSAGARFSVKNRYDWSVAAAVTMHYKTGPASLATPTSSYRVALWIVVARVSPYRARTAHQRKQLSRVVTVILSTVVGFFSYVTVVEELQPTSILKFHRWTVFWKPRYRCFYTGSIRCYVLNKLDASSNGIYAL